MTTQQPEPQPQADQPERVAEPNPAYGTDEFVAPQEGEQGDGDTEPGDDSDNPMAGVDVSELEAPDPVADAGQDVAEDADQAPAEDDTDRTEAYRDRLPEHETSETGTEIPADVDPDARPEGD